MTKTDLVVVPDHAGRCGSITWWRLSGTLNYDALEEAWLAAGLEPGELPSPPSDADALKRALMPLRGPRTLLRTLPQGAGFAVVDESFVDNDGDVDPEYTVRFKTWIDYDALELRFEPELDVEQVQAIADRFAAARRELDATDLSSWLVRRVNKHDSVALRDTGGIYFVPEHRAKDWSAFADVMHKVSASRVHEIPALRSDRAVEAVMAAVIADAEASIAALTKRIESSDITERGLRSQAARCGQIADKLRTYEELLGVRMNDMRKVVEETDAHIAALLIAQEVA